MSKLIELKQLVVPYIFTYQGREIYTEEQPQDKESLEKLKTLVVRWAIDNKFLTITTGSYQKDSKVIPNIITEGSKKPLIDYIYTLNFKVLYMKSNLDLLLRMLADTEQDKTISRLLDLQTKILMEVDSRFMLCYINKLIYILESTYPGVVREHTWSDIFKTYPYIWLIYELQNIMREYTPISK